MIRQGKLCRQCSSKKCNDIGTEAEPIDIECPSCNGGGCNQCNEGYYRVDGCPNNYCSGMVNAIDLFELFAKGMPPISGGALDQSVSFLQAARYFENEERRIKNE